MTPALRDLVARWREWAECVAIDADDLQGLVIADTLIDCADELDAQLPPTWPDGDAWRQLPPKADDEDGTPRAT